jgi:Uma2 family endonuclease
MDATATRMTVDQFHAVAVEGDRTQLVDGRVVVSQPRPIHALLQGRILLEFVSWSETAPGRGLASLPTEVVLDEYNAFGPDVIWIAEEHRPPDLRQYLERVPDICVEVRSPSTWRYDVGAKKAAYERGGLPELWLVDDRTPCVLVFRRSRREAPTFDVALELGQGDELASSQLPGFALAVDRLFRDA